MLPLSCRVESVPTTPLMPSGVQSSRVPGFNRSPTCRLHLGEELEDLVALPFQTVHGLTPTYVLPPGRATPRPTPTPTTQAQFRQQRHPPTTLLPLLPCSTAADRRGTVGALGKGDSRRPSSPYQYWLSYQWERPVPPLQGSHQQCPISTTTCQPSTSGSITVSRPREGEVGAALPTDTALTTTECLRAGTVACTTAVDHQGIYVAAMRNPNWSLSSGSIHPSQTIKCWGS